MNASQDRLRSSMVYALMVVVGVAAFLYPFWLPASALANQAHSGDAPMVAALVGALVIVAVTDRAPRRSR